MNKVLLNDIKGLICSDEVVVSMVERLSDEVIWKCIWEMEGCVECWNNESYKCCCDWMCDLEERLMEEYLKKGVDIWIEKRIVSFYEMRFMESVESWWKGEMNIEKLFYEIELISGYKVVKRYGSNISSNEKIDYKEDMNFLYESLKDVIMKNDYCDDCLECFNEGGFKVCVVWLEMWIKELIKRGLLVELSDIEKIKRKLKYNLEDLNEMFIEFCDDVMVEEEFLYGWKNDNYDKWVSGVEGLKLVRNDLFDELREFEGWSDEVNDEFCFNVLVGGMIDNIKRDK